MLSPHISAFNSALPPPPPPVSASAPSGCFPRSSLKAMRPRCACEASLSAREVMQARYWSAESAVEHSFGCHRWNIPGSVERMTDRRDLTYLKEGTMIIIPLLIKKTAKCLNYLHYQTTAFGYISLL